MKGNSIVMKQRVFIWISPLLVSLWRMKRWVILRWAITLVLVNFLGTHGHMKCIFDNQLKSQDTPLLMLYKRVFPKWTYNDYVPPVNLSKPSTKSSDEMAELYDW